jgi:hypothetical protein
MVSFMVMIDQKLSAFSRKIMSLNSELTSPAPNALL